MDQTGISSTNKLKNNARIPLDEHNAKEPLVRKKGDASHLQTILQVPSYSARQPKSQSCNTAASFSGDEGRRAGSLDRSKNGTIVKKSLAQKFLPELLKVRVCLDDDFTVNSSHVSDSIDQGDYSSAKDASIIKTYQNKDVNASPLKDQCCSAIGFANRKTGLAKPDFRICQNTFTTVLHSTSHIGYEREKTQLHEMGNHSNNEDVNVGEQSSILSRVQSWRNKVESTSPRRTVAISKTSSILNRCDQIRTQSNNPSPYQGRSFLSDDRNSNREEKEAGDQLNSSAEEFIEGMAAPSLANEDSSRNPREISFQGTASELVDFITCSVTFAEALKQKLKKEGRNVIGSRNPFEVAPSVSACNNSFQKCKDEDKAGTRHIYVLNDRDADHIFRDLRVQPSSKIEKQGSTTSSTRTGQHSRKSSAKHVPEESTVYLH